MKQSPRKHRTPAQWQSIIDKYVASGLSGMRFCEEHTIGYASFCKWRQRLLSAPQAPQAHSAPSFVDLSSLGQLSGASWHITLRLGNGVELVLSQG